MQKPLLWDRIRKRGKKAVLDVQPRALVLLVHSVLILYYLLLLMLTLTICSGHRIQVLVC